MKTNKRGGNKMRYIGQKILNFFTLVAPFIGIWLLGAMEQNLTDNAAEWFFGLIVLFLFVIVLRIRKLEREERRRKRRERLSVG